MDKISISQAIEGYLFAAQARRLSKHTIADYQVAFRKFLDFLGEDLPVELINSRTVEKFLASQNSISKKTLLNYHISLSALWTWMVKEELVQVHVLHKVDRPRPEKKEVRPYTQAEVKELLGSLSHSKFYTRPMKRECRHELPNVERNRAIIYLLLDTGIRAEELCGLKVYQADMKNRRITVMGKGSKERSVPFSNRTGQVLWRYLATRKQARTSEYLFVSLEDRQLNRGALLHMLKAVGERAGVVGVNVHRFRHTFAINFLRNGGDPYTLQMMLGHSTLDMVRHYLALSQVDLDRVHLDASPVDRWRL